MKREDLLIAARIVRKYISAVETTLYWNMTTREARDVIAEASTVAEMLETAASTKITETQ
jgi:hypothetical protein